MKEGNDHYKRCLIKKKIWSIFYQSIWKAHIWISTISLKCWVFPGDSDSKESTCNAGDPASIPESARFPGEGKGNPHQYSCLENSMDRGDPGSISGSARFPREGNGNPHQYSCLENSMDRGTWWAMDLDSESLGLQRVGHDWVTNTFTFTVLNLLMS